MITGIIGKPGHGKTLRLTWLVGQYVKAGRKVCTNIELTADCPFADRVARLDDPSILTPDGRAMMYPVFNVVDGPVETYYPIAWGKDGDVTRSYKAFWHYVPKGWVVAVSEATQYWDSLDFAGMPKVCREYWAQHRKMGHTIILDYQNMDNLYNRIRRQTETFVVTEHNARTHWLFRYVPITWSRFIADSFSHEALRSQDYMESNHISYEEAMQVFGWYRTDQIYGSFGTQLEVVNNGHAFSSGVGRGETGRTAEGNGDSAIGAAPSSVDQVVAVGGGGGPAGPGLQSGGGVPVTTRRPGGYCRRVVRSILFAFLPKPAGAAPRASGGVA